MKRLTLATVLLAALAAAAPLSRDVRAGAIVQRCETRDGSVIYTDQACALFKARAVPMAGPALSRIVRAGHEGTQDTEVAAPLSALAPARRSPQDGCARSPTQLAMDLQASLGSGDVNRLAESYHWVGLTHAQSRPVMQRLERLLDDALVDVSYFDAQLGTGGYAEAGSHPADASVTGIMQLSFGADGTQIRDFLVHRYAGCYFVRF